MPVLQTQAGRLGRGETTNGTDAARYVDREGFLILELPDKVLSWDARAAEMLSLPPSTHPPLEWEQLVALSPRRGLIGWHPSTIALRPSVGPLELDEEFVIEGIRGEIIRLHGSRKGGQVILRLRSLAASDDQFAKLERLNRLGSVGMLAASLAHEIKNSLVAVKTFISLALERKKDLELGRVAAGEVDRIHALAMRMLDYSSAPPLESKALDLHNIIEQSIAIVRHEALRLGIRVRPELFARDHRVRGRAPQLEQALINLFLNAFAAMESGGELRIVSENVILPVSKERDHGAAGTGEWVRLCIIDTGCGIAPENLGQVFDPFFTTRNEGTGLGLSITRDIIENHSGVIHVESTVGEGTTFRVFLPVAGCFVQTDGVRKTAG